jgi:hypothetical protein
MASFIVDYDDKAIKKMFAELKDIFPEISAQLLGFVGVEAKQDLKKKFLSGQEINLRKYPKDVEGHPTISYSIGKGAKSVKISSYPLNLFERGRKLRSGRKESGKRIMKKKFKQYMMTRMSGLLNQFDNTYLKRKMAKI